MRPEPGAATPSHPGTARNDPDRTEPEMPEQSEVPFRGMLIGGELVEATGGATLPSVNPATEQVIGSVPEASAEDVDRAVQGALKAGQAWRDRTWTQRAAVLRQYAQVLEDNAEELAYLDAIDSGNPIASMRADVQGAVGEIRYFAGIAGETKGRTVPSGPDALTYTEFVP